MGKPVAGSKSRRPSPAGRTDEAQSAGSPRAVHSDALESRQPSRRDLQATENRSATGRLPRSELAELWRYRELVFFFALRDIKLRYKQTALGVAWVVLQPLMAMAVFTIVFGRLAGIPSNGLPYALFVYTGLTLWFYVATSTNMAAESLVRNRDLVTKIYFPRLIAPASAVVAPVVDLTVATALVAALMALYSVAPTEALVSLPLWLLAAFASTLGAGMWFSALNVLYRDVRYALPFFVQVWFFASPVVFPTALFPENWRLVFALNPLVGIIDGFRWSLVGAPTPGMYSVVSLVMAVVLLATGLIYFDRAERRFADVI